jgi:MFS transporter, PAT family, beta-lactamase induction signal transducer AmpG
MLRTPSSTQSSAPLSSSQWRWIPSLYFAEGLPYVVVMIVAVIMYKRLGISNTEIALYTSWLYLPWVIKPLWSPLVEIFKTRRIWIVVTQLLVGAGLAGVALTIPGDNFLRWTMVFLWLLAFSSATHDVAADGFYMLALSDHDQAWFVGVRNTFYRLAMIAGQGLLVMLAGFLETASGLPELTIEIRATPTASIVADTISGSPLEFSPDRIPRPSAEGPQRIVAHAEVVEVDLSRQPRATIEQLVQSARDWNVEHGFYSAPEEKGPSTDQSASATKSTLLESLENFLSRKFGAQRSTEASDTHVGNAALVLMNVSRPVPEGETLIVQFGRRRGDKSFSIVEGTRFVVTPANSELGFAAVVQLDAKLDTPSQASFSARSGNFPFAWSTTFFVLAGFFLMVGFYHLFMLPHPDTDIPGRIKGAESMAQQGLSGLSLVRSFFHPLVTFFQKKQLIIILAFLLLYRFAEAQLAKLATPFLVDAREAGGLALTTGEVGFVYGTVGVAMLTLGGLLGGFVAARHGLKFWIWPMVIAINLPNAAYVFLSQAMPESFWAINIAVGIEQFGYGFGFTAYMLYMLYISQGEHQTVHYALCTGVMALGMMIPGMLSGWLQEIIGYQHFFIWVMLATIPGFLVTAIIPLDAEFGRRK